MYFNIIIAFAVTLIFAITESNTNMKINKKGIKWELYRVVYETLINIR